MITLNDFKRLIRPIQNKIFLLLGKGIVKLIKNSVSPQRITATVLKDETLDTLERFQEYGFETYPFKGSEAAIGFMNGNRGLGLVLCIQDRRYRPTDLEEGEIAMYTHEDKTSPFRIHMKNGRTVNIVASTVNIIANNVRLGSSSSSEVKKLVNETFRDLFDNHTHIDAGICIQKMNDSHFTANTKAK